MYLIAFVYNMKIKTTNILFSNRRAKFPYDFWIINFRKSITNLSRVGTFFPLIISKQIFLKFFHVAKSSVKFSISSLSKKALLIWPSKEKEEPVIISPLHIKKESKVSFTRRFCIKLFISFILIEIIN